MWQVSLSIIVKKCILYKYAFIFIQYEILHSYNPIYLSGTYLYYIFNDIYWRKRRYSGNWFFIELWISPIRLSIDNIVVWAEQKVHCCIRTRFQDATTWLSVVNKSARCLHKNGAMIRPDYCWIFENCNHVCSLEKVVYRLPIHIPYFLFISIPFCVDFHKTLYMYTDT